MKRTITEESILFASIIKWFVLASCTGMIVGLAATVFLGLLGEATQYAGYFSYTFLFLPGAFFVSSLLTKYLAPGAEGHGTEKVIEAVHRYGSQIPLAVVPVKLVATIITLGIGGSAGKEGPCAQIGAGLSSFFARVLHLSETDRKKLVICGISAGFATVFGTPIAGAIFGVEVLFVGGILYDVLLPSFVAGITAYQISSFFGIPYLHPSVRMVPAINEMLLLKVIVAAVLFGIVSLCLIQGMQAGKKLFGRIRIWPPLKGIIGGCLLVILAFAFGKTYLGLGIPTIHSCLEGQSVSWYVPFLKIVCTAITLNCGGSGGIVTPIFFIGTTSGAVLSQALSMDVGILSAIGFVSLLAGAANTPIAASIMAVEMFGPAIGPYAAVACVVCFLMTGHRSVYPSQILAVKKSSSIAIDLGKEILHTQPSYHHPRDVIAAFLLRLWRWITSLWR